MTASTNATDPIVVTAVFYPVEGARDAVVAAMEPGITAVHAEPGCLLYAIHDAPDGSIVMIEKWESAELLDAHGAGEAVVLLNKDLAGLLAKPTKVDRLQPIPTGDAARGAL